MKVTNIFEYFLKLPEFMQIAFGVVILLCLLIVVIRIGKVLNRLLNKKITLQNGKIQIVEQRNRRSSDNEKTSNKKS